MRNTGPTDLRKRLKTWACFVIWLTVSSTLLELVKFAILQRGGSCKCPSDPLEAPLTTRVNPVDTVKSVGTLPGPPGFENFQPNPTTAVETMRNAPENTPGTTTTTITSSVVAQTGPTATVASARPDLDESLRQVYRLAFGPTYHRPQVAVNPQPDTAQVNRPPVPQSAK